MEALIRALIEFLRVPAEYRARGLSEAARASAASIPRSAFAYRGPAIVHDRRFGGWMPSGAIRAAAVNPADVLPTPGAASGGGATAQNPAYQGFDIGPIGGFYV